MPLWALDGKLIVDGDGKLIACDECPCDELINTSCCESPVSRTLHIILKKNGVQVAEFDIPFLEYASGGGTTEPVWAGHGTYTGTGADGCIFDSCGAINYVSFSFEDRGSCSLRIYLGLGIWDGIEVHFPTCFRECFLLSGTGEITHDDCTPFTASFASGIGSGFCEDYWCRGSETDVVFSGTVTAT